MKISFWIDKTRRYLRSKLLETQTVKKKNRALIEKVLLTRLKLLGYILLGFGISFLSYAFDLSVQPDTLTVDACEEMSANETLNFFLIASVFTFLGILCLFTSWKKTRNKKK